MLLASEVVTGESKALTEAAREAKLQARREARTAAGIMHTQDDEDEFDAAELALQAVEAALDRR